ncbi:MAG: hypothetical protein ACFB15_22995 [Cyclobacteriaceae bacterium]
MYNLTHDQGQNENLNENHPQSEFYQQMVNDQLAEIQQNGYYWDDLPKAEGTKKLKTDWVKYKR